MCCYFFDCTLESLLHFPPITQWKETNRFGVRKAKHFRPSVAPLLHFPKTFASAAYAFLYRREDTGVTQLELQTGAWNFVFAGEFLTTAVILDLPRNDRKPRRTSPKRTDVQRRIKGTGGTGVGARSWYIDERGKNAFVRVPTAFRSTLVRFDRCVGEFVKLESIHYSVQRQRQVAYNLLLT